LRDVEHSEAFQEWHRFGRVAVLRRAFDLGLRNEAIGIADGGATLALADITADLQRLPEGQPVLGGKPLFNDRPPQDQNIHP
jgi:hypothetical protein